LEPAFALDRGLKAARAFEAVLTAFALDAVLVLLVLTVELDAALALPVEAGPEALAF